MDDQEYEVYDKLSWKQILGAFAAIIGLIMVLFTVFVP